MNSSLSMKLQIATAGIAVALLSGGCAMAPQANPEFAPPGSTRTFNYRATGSFGSVTDQRKNVILPDRIWEGRTVRASEGKDFTTLADPATAGSIAQVKGTQPLFTFNPPLSWEWPLTVGKTWTRQHTVTVHATKRTIPFEATWIVESYEDVTVPAGTFKAFKVKYSDGFLENTSWWVPKIRAFAKLKSVRTSKHSAGVGTIDQELVSYTQGK